MLHTLGKAMATVEEDERPRECIRLFPGTIDQSQVTTNQLVIITLWHEIYVTMRQVNYIIQSSTCQPKNVWDHEKAHGSPAPVHGLGNIDHTSIHLAEIGICNVSSLPPYCCFFVVPAVWA